LNKYYDLLTEDPLKEDKRKQLQVNDKEVLGLKQIDIKDYENCLNELKRGQKNRTKKNNGINK